MENNAHRQSNYSTEISIESQRMFFFHTLANSEYRSEFLNFRFLSEVNAIIRRITCETVCLRIKCAEFAAGGSARAFYEPRSAARRRLYGGGGRRWVKIDKQSIPSVHVGRGPSSLYEW